MSNDKVKLCRLPSDLPTPLALYGEPIRLSTSDDVRELRSRVREAAIARGFAEPHWFDLVTAVNEAAHNAIRYAGGGVGRVCVSDDTVQVWVEDVGGGIATKDLPRTALSQGDGVGTKIGFEMMLRTAARIYLLTGQAGTTVVLEQEGGVLGAEER